MVLLGPTGVGKTDLSVEVARRLGTAVVSCDSRQVYREMRIGTAAPTEAQLAAVPHYLVREVSVREYFNCWQFERRALEVIRGLLEERDSVGMAGGSMVYVDAVCEGIDEVPDVRPEVRERVGEAMRERGPEFVREWLRRLDPAHYGRVDLRNWKRVAHAVEVCLSSGRPYSSFLTGRKREREFAIVKAGLWREREELYGRIDRRVDEMVAEGLEEEARGLYAWRELNALNTVGYKEWFDFFDGKVTREEAVRLIKRNTRHYAKKQMSWFRRDGSIRWFHADDREGVWAFLRERLGLEG